MHGDMDETKVTTATTDVLLAAYGFPGISIEELKEGMIVASKYIQRFVGGEIVMSAVFD